MATPVYNTMLAVFYLLVIRFKWKDDKLRKYEPVFHIIPITFALATAIASIPLKLYNRTMWWCMISNPKGGNTIYSQLFFTIPLCVSICTSIIVSVFTVLHVYKTEQRAKKYITSNVRTTSQEQQT